MFERFYKVFVSSTYEDLRDERAAVYDALMRCKCFPVGMEQFPASNLGPPDLIRQYIQQCDYFLVISGGIYGSLVPGQSQHIGYVEWEYDYARQLNLPCYSFLAADLGKIVGAKLDKGKNVKLLEDFRAKLQSDGKTSDKYTSVDELGKKVLHAFTDAPKSSRAVGWIRADDIPGANQLMGAWKLVHSNKVQWCSSTIIKVFSANEFVWTELDSKGKSSFICGHYELLSPYGSGDSGDTILEIPRATSFPSMKDVEQEYEIEISGNTLKTWGKRSNDSHFEEEFHRMDLSKGLNFVN